MDVYGAFQLCAIGILAAPVTAMKSNTYFFEPGRNAIFLWTVLLLAGEYIAPIAVISYFPKQDLDSDQTHFRGRKKGLLSLTVEFFRSDKSDCMHDDSGNPISQDPAEFLDKDNARCGLTCSVKEGPFSPLRGGAANNIYVIPAPHKLSFGMGTLVAAACCIPAILSLVSMWNKILETNWKARSGKRREKGEETKAIDEPIPGTNGATVGKMKGVNATIRRILGVVEIPLFGGFVLAILIIGERNFFSAQLMYQTEPVPSIGM